MIHSLEEVAQLMGGELRGGDARFTGASIDTRQLQPDQLFFALKGERVDGAEFVGQAEKAGAAAAVVEDFVASELPQIRVKSSADALQQLGAEKRRRFFGAVIAVTGSSGKTTTKEMLRSVLSQAGSVLAPPHSYNNRLGVSLTLACLEQRHRYAVLEIGANAPGEIAELAQLVQPKVALITNAGRAHLEGFGSIEGVAAEKGSLLSVLNRDDVAVLPAEDRFFRDWSRRAGNSRVVSYGKNGLADCRLVELQENEEGLHIALELPTGLLKCKLRVSGVHNGVNAAGAAAVAMVLGIRPEHLRAGLVATQPMNGRLVRLQGPKDSCLYDDSYNANPDSVRSAIDFLAGRRGRRILVLGDMAELGEQAPQLHRDIGAYAREKGIDELYALGSMADATVKGFAGCSGKICESLEALAKSVRRKLSAETTALVKGSRSSGMERVIALLQGQKA